MSKKIASCSFKIDRKGMGMADDIVSYQKGDVIAEEDIELAGDLAIESVDAVEQGLGKEVLESELNDLKEENKKLAEEILTLKQANENLTKKIKELESVEQEKVKEDDPAEEEVKKHPKKKPQTKKSTKSKNTKKK